MTSFDRDNQQFPSLLQGENVSLVPRAQATVKRNAANDISGSGAAAVVVKKTVSDIDFSLFLTDNTVRDYQKYGTDAVVVVEKRLADGLKGLVAYDIGNKNTRVTGTYSTRVQGSRVELQGTWLQKPDNFVQVAAAYEIDSSTSVNGTFNLSNQSAAGNYLYHANDGNLRGFPLEAPNNPLAFYTGYKYSGNGATLGLTHQRDDWTFKPLYDFERNAPILTVANRRGQDTFRGTYDVKDEQAAFEWQRNNVRVFALAGVNQNGIHDVSAGVRVEKEIQL